jgi:F-type H+-transporting ATPase subunit epsilon
MENKTFPFRLLALGGEVLSGEITQLEVKTFEGSLGIMAGHEPLVAACPAGIIRIEQDETWVRFKAEEFVLTVDGKSATILTPFAKYAGQI